MEMKRENNPRGEKKIVWFTDLILNIMNWKSENDVFKDASWNIIQGNLHNIFSQSIVVTETETRSLDLTAFDA